MGVSTVRLSGESPTRRLSMSKGPPPIDFSTRLALRPAECAVALGVCERTLRRWMRDERLPFFRVERGVFIPSAELERWMHDRIESEQATTKLADEILNDF
jgi:excisionase family DNA binding protein